jgi:hypothetical protein
MTCGGCPAKHAPVSPQREPDAQSRVCCHPRSRGRRGQAGRGRHVRGWQRVGTDGVMSYSELGSAARSMAGTRPGRARPGCCRGGCGPCPSTTSRSPLAFGPIPRLGQFRDLLCQRGDDLVDVLAGGGPGDAVVTDQRAGVARSRNHCSPTTARQSRSATRGLRTPNTPPCARSRPPTAATVRRPSSYGAQTQRALLASAIRASTEIVAGTVKPLSVSSAPVAAPARWQKTSATTRKRPPGRADCAGPPRKRGLTPRSWLKRRRTRRKRGYG